MNLSKEKQYCEICTNFQTGCGDCSYPDEIRCPNCKEIVYCDKAHWHGGTMGYWTCLPKRK